MEKANLKIISFIALMISAYSMSAIGQKISSPMSSFYLATSCAEYDTND